MKNLEVITMTGKEPNNQWEEKIDYVFQDQTDYHRDVIKNLVKEVAQSEYERGRQEAPYSWLSGYGMTRDENLKDENGEMWHIVTFAKRGHKEV